MSGDTRLLLLTVSAGPLQLLVDVTGETLGTVSDPSGAAIAGAEIKATYAATGVVQDTVSDGLGALSDPGTSCGSLRSTRQKRRISRL
jgi:hypothetical protein